MTIDRVSVIITTYKRSKAILQRAINTVLAQTYDDIELILVNDYPDYDEMIRDLLESNPSIKYICHEKNMGACKSRNDGVQIATGKYLAFLDDDDEWTTDKIAKQVAKIQSTKASLVYCTGEYHTPNDQVMEMNFIIEPPSNPIKAMLHENFMGGCSFPLIDRNAFVSVGGFDVSMPSSQDYDLWLRILEIGKVAFIDEPLVIYHLQDDSITSSVIRRINGYERLITKHKNLYYQYKEELGWKYSKIIDLYWGGGYYRKAYETFCKSMKIFPYNYKVLMLLPRLLYLSIKNRS